MIEAFLNLMEIADLLERSWREYTVVQGQKTDRNLVVNAINAAHVVDRDT